MPRNILAVIAMLCIVLIQLGCSDDHHFEAGPSPTEERIDIEERVQDRMS